MPVSEIDEIFASKPKTKGSSPPPKTKKRTKRSSSKRSNHHPETVVDPSSRHRPPKRQKTDGQSALPKKSSPRHDDDRFKDSRGTGSRRKTEEGYSVYKEDELGIGNEGGGAPLQSSASRLITLPKTRRYVPLTVIAASDYPCTTSIQKRQTHL
ncbi:hypothetical protein EDD16DRAFT_1734744 [Pisolithus croceorrhizus]|nr:hypothetical protein EDD16DRAFT_1734744 [Pisolithus croceorrhizus]KAI6133996.1 hypothetical protein EV401DRAFT_2064174 [Pisolithus croceorrhizus]